MKLGDINQVIDINMKFLPENYYKEFWLTTFDKGKDYSFVALISGEIIGYILCDGTSIISLAVDSKYRSQGIGNNLINHCLKSISNGTNIFLYCRKENTKAFAIYIRVGFEIAEEIPSYYINPPDDAYKMVLVNDKSKTNNANKKILISI